MKPIVSCLLTLIIALGMLGGTAHAAALIGPCSPSATYDPACDVNQDGIVNVLDIQLTAGHWNQTGTWTGGGNGWTLTGNAGTDPATNFVGTTDGQDLIVQPGAGRVGVGTTSPANGKLQVDGDSGLGLYATSTGADAVLGEAATAFFAGVKGTNSASNGIGVRGEANASGSVGVWGQSTANTGVYGLSTNGIAVWGQSTSGVAIKAESTYNDGVHVNSGGTGVYVALAAFLDGMAVGSAGSDGLHVYSAFFNGVYANTTQPSGQWGFFTSDRIFGTIGMFSALSLVARVGGPDALAPGDLVAVAGVADPLPGSTAAMPLVRLADGTAGIVGVVEHRLALTSWLSRPAATVGEAAARAGSPGTAQCRWPCSGGRLRGDYRVGRGPSESCTRRERYRCRHAPDRCPEWHRATAGHDQGAIGGW